MKKLNSKEAAKKLHDDLLKHPEITAYQSYEQAIAKHPEIASLEEELKAMQQEMILKKGKNEDYSELENTYNQKMQQFVNHPLVVNYMNAREDANSLLLEVESLINNGIAAEDR